jgi:folate-dependent phosphoribosylglycinamide formyltransferase PurN
VKLLVLCGSHPRHLFVAQQLITYGVETLVIQMVREELIPSLPDGTGEQDAFNFNRHFIDRSNAETREFGLDPLLSCKEKYINHKISRDELNSDRVLRTVNDYNPDFCIIFGTDLIKLPLMSILPRNTFNLHLGLSPWFRGSATLFWPFVMLQPQYAGITIHRIVEKPDAGEIIHQACPLLNNSQGIHDVAVEAIKIFKNPVYKMFESFEQGKELAGIMPKSEGKIWRTSDFKMQHLRLIYNIYENKIVHEYLKGTFGINPPNLISTLE